MTIANGKEPKFDKSRISHKESKRSAILGARLRKAIDDGDIELMESLMDDLDNAIAKIVEYIPADWFMDGFDVKYGEPGLFDGLKQDKYDELMAAVTPKQPGEKDSLGWVLFLKRKHPKQVILDEDEAYRINRVQIGKFYGIPPAAVDEMSIQDVDDTLQVMWADNQQ